MTLHVIFQSRGFDIAQRAKKLQTQVIIETIKSLAEYEKGIYLVAERDGKIVGHAFLEPLHLNS